MGVTAWSGRLRSSLADFWPLRLAIAARLPGDNGCGLFFFVMSPVSYVIGLAERAVRRNSRYVFSDITQPGGIVPALLVKYVKKLTKAFPRTSYRVTRHTHLDRRALCVKLKSVIAIHHVIYKLLNFPSPLGTVLIKRIG